jgi:hypothetical protein
MRRDDRGSLSILTDSSPARGTWFESVHTPQNGVNHSAGLQCAPPETCPFQGQAATTQPQAAAMREDDLIEMYHGGTI